MMEKTIEFLNSFRFPELIYITVLFMGGLFFIINDNRNQAKRTDKLYEMFVNLRKDSDQKFYDLLKEKK